MKVVTISGSMKFQDEMIEVALELEKKFGYCVLQCVYNFGEKLSEKDIEKITEAHWKRIDLCDMLYVVNVGGYIGDSTRKEIEYAKRHGKEVEYFQPIE